MARKKVAYIEEQSSSNISQIVSFSPYVCNWKYQQIFMFRLHYSFIFFRHSLATYMSSAKINKIKSEGITVYIELQQRIL